MPTPESHYEAVSSRPSASPSAGVCHRTEVELLGLPFPVSPGLVTQQPFPAANGCSAGQQSVPLLTKSDAVRLSTYQAFFKDTFSHMKAQSIKATGTFATRDITATIGRLWSEMSDNKRCGGKSGSLLAWVGSIPTTKPHVPTTRAHSAACHLLLSVLFGLSTQGRVREQNGLESSQQEAIGRPGPSRKEPLCVPSILQGHLPVNQEGPPRQTHQSELRL